MLVVVLCCRAILLLLLLALLKLLGFRLVCGLGLGRSLVNLVLGLGRH